MKPIHILLYEDKPSYRDSFKLKAQQKRILVDATDNVDELIEILEANPKKHKFVVLDARAYLHEGQGEGTESEANLHKIFREIAKISKQQDRLIPYCINTGFAELKLQYQEVLQCPIYEKGKEDELIQFIWDTYNDSEGAKLRTDFPDVFSFADVYFDDANVEVLSSLLLKRKYESTNISDRIDSLARLRRLTEHTMDIIYINHLQRQTGIIRNRSTRASDVINYLNDAINVPTQVFGSVINILRTASNYGSHTPEEAEATSDYPTNNSIISLTHGFFEIIYWTNKLLS
jgi:hypothetical protein